MKLKIHLKSNLRDGSFKSNYVHDWIIIVK